jgi:hypothetical protein
MGDGQSNTGKARTKRAAVPNNPKMRKQLRKIASDKKEGMTFAKRKAIRDAKKPKRPTTEFGKEGMALKGEKKGPLEVRYRALAKKIRQCQELEAKKKEGGELDRWQQAKLRKKLFLKAEMKNLKAAVGGEGEEGTEGSDEDEESEESEEEEVKPPAPKRLKK